VIGLEDQVKALEERLRLLGQNTRVESRRLQSGAFLVKILDYTLPAGWSRPAGAIIFIAPVGFPGAQPDCFWIAPTGLRLADGSTPQSSNDANAIPEVPEEHGTWFSWHVQTWSPSRDTLVTYFNVIRERLDPPR
jgi:hypothetical protein